jgi:hypothetical protein
MGPPSILNRRKKLRLVQLRLLHQDLSPLPFVSLVVHGQEFGDSPHSSVHLYVLSNTGFTRLIRYIPFVKDQCTHGSDINTGSFRNMVYHSKGARS